MYFKLADRSNRFLRNFGFYVKDNVMSKLGKLQDDYEMNNPLPRTYTGLCLLKL